MYRLSFLNVPPSVANQFTFWRTDSHTSWSAVVSTLILFCVFLASPCCYFFATATTGRTNGACD